MRVKLTRKQKKGVYMLKNCVVKICNVIVNRGLEDLSYFLILFFFILMPICLYLARLLRLSPI